MRHAGLRLLTLTLACTLVQGLAQGVVVTFPDANLEAAVRTAINQPTGDIQDTDVAGLTSFSASGAGIADLSGLENATGLTALDLATNQIADVSPLAGLTNLLNLDLNENQITDASPLSGLTNLTFLFIDENQLADVSPLPA